MNMNSVACKCRTYLSFKNEERKPSFLRMNVLADKLPNINFRCDLRKSLKLLGGFSLLDNPTNLAD